MVYIVLFPLLKRHWKHSNITGSPTLWWGSESIGICSLPWPVNHPRLPAMFLFQKQLSLIPLALLLSWLIPYHCSFSASSWRSLLIHLYYFINSFLGFGLAPLSKCLRSVQGQDSDSTMNSLPWIRNILSTPHLLCLSKSTPQPESLFPHTDAPQSAQPQHRKHTGHIHSTTASVSFPLLPVLNLTQH